MTPSSFAPALSLGNEIVDFKHTWYMGNLHARMSENYSTEKPFFEELLTICFLWRKKAWLG
jgi:hypothetical protein